MRGDIGFGNDGYLCGCEVRELPHLFKVKMSKNIQKLIIKLATCRTSAWQPASGGWDVIETQLKLTGWSRARRIVVMRRPVSTKGVRPRHEPDWFSRPMAGDPQQEMEYAALVCSADQVLDSMPKLYAERAIHELAPVPIPALG